MCDDDLVCESLPLCVSDLLQVGDAGEVDHGRGAAHQDDGVRAGREQVLADHVLANEAAAVLPAWNKKNRTFIF